MQEDQTTKPGQPTIEDVAVRYFEGCRLTAQELAIIQSDRAATEEFIAIVKRLLAKEVGEISSLQV